VTSDKGQRAKEHGYILLPVTLALLLVGVVAYLMNVEGSMGIERTARSQQPDQARYVAEAGLAHALWQVQQSGCGGYGLADTPFGQDSYKAVVTPVGGSPVTIAATGTLAGGLSTALSRENVAVYEPPATVTLQPDAAEGKDTFLYDWKDAWNYGAHRELWAIEVSGNTYRPLLEFDLSGIPAGAAVLAATLELYQVSASNGGGPIGVYRVTNDWTEGTSSGGNGVGANWLEWDGSNAWSTPGGDFDPTLVAGTTVPNMTKDWVQWDITDLVKGWADGSYSNKGLLLKALDQFADAFFASSDASDPALRPKLVVTYACECGGGPSSTLTLQPGPEGKDGYIMPGGTQKNYGSAEKIVVKDGGERVLLQFDLSGVPAGAIITSATLEMYMESLSNYNGPGDLDIYRLTRDWVEGSMNGGSLPPDGVTWDRYDPVNPWSAPGGDFDPTLAGSAPVDPALGWHSWDVSVLVSGWVNGGNPNYGLIIVGSGTVQNAKFRSGDELVAPETRPRLTVNYSCPCGVDCSGGESDNLLMVVADPANLAPPEESKKTLVESWNYTVTLIDDGDTQANFDAAAAANDVVYVTGSVGGGTLLDKVTGTATPVINEFSGKLDNFGFSSSTSLMALRDGFTKTDPAHYISSPFGGDPVTAFTASLSMPMPSGTLAPDLQIVGGIGLLPALVTLDTGAQRWDGGSAPARRVHLPFGEAETGQLTADGKTLLKRALEWAGGLGEGGGSGGTSSLILSAAADTTLDQGSPGTNNGGNSLMQTGADAGANHWRALVEFDLSPIPAGATVTGATLRLYLDGSLGPQSLDHGAYQVTADWQEMTATWDNTGGGGSFDPTALSTTAVSTSTGWFEWSVPPALIHEWMDAVSPNYGLLLKYEGTKKNQQRKWASREGADSSLHPQLVIEYTEP